jgi:hypothetical protein
MWLPASAIIHRHLINMCPMPVKAISMLSYHFLAISRLQHLRENLAFKKDWNNEVIAQFYATIYFEEHGIES